MDVSSFRVSFLQIPSKSTGDVDWSKQMSHLIAEMDQESPEAYRSEIAALNRLRTDMRGAEGNLTGRDVIYRYFCQLECMSARFPMDRTSTLIQFGWSEAFEDGMVVQQSSVAFEKANVLFNLAAVYSQIGCASNLTAAAHPEEGGHRRAAGAFQGAAGILQWISENFLHPPLQDIQQGSLVHLAAVMLAQGQECFAWKAMTDAKSPAILAKLAAGTRQLYLTALARLSDDGFQRMLGTAWLGMLRAKERLFAALTDYFRAEMAFAAESHGECIARILAADAACKEGLGSAADPLKSIFGRLQVVLAARLETARKENGLIYHLPIPPYETLPVAEELVLAKCPTFPEAIAEAKNSVGRVDLFARLVPLRVHELVSLYSEEKSKLLRYETAKVSEADRAFQSLLTDLRFPESLERLRLQRPSGMAKPMLPSGIAECKAQLLRMPFFASLYQEVVGMESKAQGIFSEIDRLLEADKRMTPNPLSTEFYRRMGEMEKRLALVFGEVPSLLAQHQTIQEDLCLIRLPDAEIYAKLLNKPRNSSFNLLDDSEDSGLGKIEQLLQQMEEQQTQRSHALERLQAEVLADDITGRLVGQRKQQKEAMDGIFKEELAKFDHLCEQIEENVRQHGQAIDRFRLVWADLCRGGNSCQVDEIEDEDRGSSRFFASISLYQRLVERLKAIKGTIQADIIEGSAIFLLSEVQSFVEERERLRAQEELYQADQRALRGHQVLRDRLGLGHQNAIDDSKVEDGGETSKQIHDRLKRRLERLSQSAEAAVNASTVPVLEPRPARVSFKKASGIVMVPLEPSLLD